MEKIYSVGEKIAYNTSRNYYSACFIRFSTVSKILKTKIELADGNIFSLVTGKELAKDYSSSYLVDYKQAKKIVANEKAKNRVGGVVEKLVSILQRKRNYSGGYPLSSDEIRAINHLNNLLEKKEK
jgi:hypothetical protein